MLCCSERAKAVKYAESGEVVWVADVNFVRRQFCQDNFVKTILSDEKSASTGDVSKYPVNVMGNERIGGWQRLPWGMRRFSWASQGQESFPQGTKATKIAASHGRKTAFADVFYIYGYGCGFLVFLFFLFHIVTVVGDFSWHHKVSLTYLDE